MSMRWSAGFFDGEGCICIYKVWVKTSPYPRHVLTASISGTEEKNIREFTTEVGCGSVREYELKSGRKCWQWVASANNAKRALILLRPFLVGKREEATIAIEFQEGKRKIKEGHNFLSEEEIEKEIFWRNEIEELLRKKKEVP